MSISERLAAITTRADNATEEPWEVREVDDEWSASVSVEAGTRLAPGGRGRWTATDMILEHELVDDPDDDAQPNDDQRRADAEFIAHARTDVPDLVAALRAVLDLHKRTDWGDGHVTCSACWNPSEDGLRNYPCPTVRAIEAALGEDTP